VIRLAYYPEAEALLREATGAAKVVIFDHTLRDSESKIPPRCRMRRPGAVSNCVHCCSGILNKT